MTFDNPNTFEFPCGRTCTDAQPSKFIVRRVGCLIDEIYFSCDCKKCDKKLAMYCPSMYCIAKLKE